VLLLAAELGLEGIPWGVWEVDEVVALDEEGLLALSFWRAAQGRAVAVVAAGGWQRATATGAALVYTAATAATRCRPPLLLRCARRPSTVPCELAGKPDPCGL
jgi:hypothetical protein